MKDYYKILEVHPDASLEVLNNAYRALVRKYHPDLYHTRLKGPMTTKMQEINEAYNTLSVPSSREEYNRRYARHATTRQVSAHPAIQWKRMLLWALCVFLLGKFLFKPFLLSPIGRFILLGVTVVALFTLLIRFRRKS